MAIMAEGHRAFRNVAFVDAHNCFTGDISTVQPGSLAAYEYQSAALHAIEEGSLNWNNAPSGSDIPR